MAETSGLYNRETIMNAFDIDLIRQSAMESAPASRSTAHSLDRMTALQLAKRIVIFTVDAAGIAALVDKARQDIPGLTSNQMFQAVANHNPDTFWAIAKKDHFDITAPRGEGFFAVLPLTHEGMRGLIDGSLDTRKPDISFIARQSERPAGIYIWAIHAKGSLVAAISLVLQKISAPLYRGVNLYSRPVTKEGLRVLEPLGFAPGARYDGLFAPNLQMFDRSDDGRNGARDRHPRRDLHGRAAMPIRRGIRRQRFFRHASDLPQGPRAGRMHPDSVFRRFCQA